MIKVKGLDGLVKEADTRAKSFMGGWNNTKKEFHITETKEINYFDMMIEYQDINRALVHFDFYENAFSFSAHINKVADWEIVLDYSEIGDFWY